MGQRTCGQWILYSAFEGGKKVLLSESTVTCQRWQKSGRNTSFKYCVRGTIRNACRFCGMFVDDEDSSSDICFALLSTPSREWCKGDGILARSVPPQNTFLTFVAILESTRPQHHLHYEHFTIIIDKRSHFGRNQELLFNDWDALEYPQLEFKVYLFNTFMDLQSLFGFQVCVKT